MSSRDPLAPNLAIGGHRVCFGTPRKLPRAAELTGRVVVLDIAFASSSGGRRNAFEKTTLRFIEALGDRLAMWIDHHDSEHHARFAGDPRFILRTKAQHGACPEMVTPERVRAAGPIDTIVCHTDFDGLASAAKWLLGGDEPYPGADDDARAIDTRTGLPGATGARLDRAIRARPHDLALLAAVLDVLYHRLEPSGAWATIDAAGAELAPREEQSRLLAVRYRALTAELVIVDASASDAPYDRTLLLLLGQERARMAAVIDRDNITFAAPYGSGVNFLERFGLSGGMPTCVSVHRAQLVDALVSLGVEPSAATAVETPPLIVES